MTAGLLALYAGVRGIIYLALLLLVGTQVSGALLARQGYEPGLAESLHRRLARLPAAILPIAIAAMLARGALQLASLLDPGDSITPTLVREGLLRGSWGHAWLLQVVAASATLLIVGYGPVRMRYPDRLLIVLTIAVLWAQTGMGHAAGETWSGPAGRLLDFVHIGGVGLWLGTLAVLAIAALPLLDSPARLPELASMVRAFSVYARVGVSLAVLSGTIAAVVYAGGSVTAIVQSTWGRLLLIKLCGLLAVLALGWYNWRIATPALERCDPQSSRRLRRAIGFELAVGVLMLAITTVLVVSPLPGEQ